MRRAFFLSVSFAVLMFLISLHPAQNTFAQSPVRKLDGKEVFLKNNCNNCHDVSSAGITAKSHAMGAPDLIDVTGGPKKRHEQAWERKFIRQNEVHVACSKVDPSKNGKKHPFLFKGNQEEEDALVAWLDEQRSK